MGVGLERIFTIYGCLAAEAYAQSGLTTASETAAAPAQTLSDPTEEPMVSDRRFLDFQMRIFTARAARERGYRESPDFDCASLKFPDFPAELVPELFALAKTTGCQHSLFRYHNRFEPTSYEIRRGTPNGTDSLILGGEIFSAVEEEFFGSDFVAHIHPPGQDPYPTVKDLGILLERLWRSPGRVFRHIVFGFAGHWPTATLLVTSSP